jgi:ribosomal protein S18 acetylase RimI-like enzyme
MLRFWQIGWLQWRWTSWMGRMTITTRPATFDDVDALVQVLCAISALPAGEIRERLEEDFRHDAREQVRGEIANSITYVICADDMRVGRLRVVRTTDYIEIAGLQVDPARQSQGIGTAVTNEILDEGRRTGLPVELDVSKENPNAERLYTRLGFHRIGENDKDYRMRRI